jgi:hypothetical protein
VKVVERAHSSSAKPVVVAVGLTIAACGLGLIGYQRLVPASGAGHCSCVEAEGSGRSVGQITRDESVTLALAAIASARSGHATGEQAEPDGAGVPADTTRDPNQDLVVSPEEIRTRQKADANTLDAQLGSEEVDVTWASKVERATTEAVARLGRNMHLEEVTCRETLCRARLTHADPRMHDDDVDRLLSMPMIAGQALALPSANDERSTVLYFSRKGTTLSVFQPAMRMIPLPSISEELPASN